jgi:uncharacterized membrane protein
MIETHVVNAVLKTTLKDEPLFAVITFANGLVAASFLFCAGVALAISLHRKWQAFTGFSKTLWRYLFRLVFILVVAYSLHVPIFSLRQMEALHDDNQWMPFFQSDILQVISITLFLVVVMALIVRKEKRLILFSVIVALVIVFISPIIREMDHSSLPVWFRPYLTMQFKSQFPLFPWSAFLISGTIAGFWFLRIKEEGKEPVMMPRLALLALGAIILSLLIEIIPIMIYPNHNFWRASPEFFFVRLGIVLLLFVYLWWFEDRLTISPRSPMVLLGQESLLVYVVHLLVVYGHTYEWSFIRLFGHTLNYLECFGLFAALSFGMFILAYFWHWLKGWNGRLASGVQFIVLSAIVGYFILK